MGLEVKKSLKLLVIVFLATVFSAALGMLLSWNPYGIVFKLPWLLLAVYVFSRQEEVASVWLHSIWLFAIPFGIGYLATKGRLQNPEMAKSVYFQSKILVLHASNYLLYVATGYATILWSKKR